MCSRYSSCHWKIDYRHRQQDDYFPYIDTIKNINLIFSWRFKIVNKYFKIQSNDYIFYQWKIAWLEIIYIYKNYSMIMLCSSNVTPSDGMWILSENEFNRGKFASRGQVQTQILIFVDWNWLNEMASTARRGPNRYSNSNVNHFSLMFEQGVRKKEREKSQLDFRNFVLKSLTLNG